MEGIGSCIVAWNGMITHESCCFLLLFEARDSLDFISSRDVSMNSSSPAFAPRTNEPSS
jgi:hypothetical protein